MRPIVSSFMLVAVVALALSLPRSFAQDGKAADSSAAAANTAQKQDLGFFGLIAAGGWVGHLIILLSVAAVALCIEHGMSIRRGVLMPPGLAEQIHEMLKGGFLQQAEQQCKLQPSFLSYVLHAGITEVDAGWPVVEKAMEDTAAEQAARIFRKIDYLSVIGNIAPMLGLLGTVLGMVMAFKVVAETQGVARASDLAEGIYTALITTVEGLVVAIPSLAAFAFFRNRADQLVAEATYVAQHVFSPLRRKGAKPPRSQAVPGTAGTAPPGASR